MRFIIVAAVIALGFFLGYKSAEYRRLKERVNLNIEPIVEQMKIELAEIKEKIEIETDSNIKDSLELRKQKIIDLLSNFYGITKENANKYF